MCERAHTAGPSANGIASPSHPPNSTVSPLSDWLSCTYTNLCPLGLWWFWSWSCVSTRPVLFRHFLSPVLLPCNCLPGVFASFLPFQSCLWIQLCSHSNNVDHQCVITRFRTTTEVYTSEEQPIFWFGSFWDFLTIRKIYDKICIYVISIQDRMISC